MWVPVETEGLKYSKDTTYSNTYGIYEERYKNYTDWADNVKTEESANTDLSMEKNIESVAKYGGFYIGRYEAGNPGTASISNGKIIFTPLGEGDSISKVSTATTTLNGYTVYHLPVIKKGYIQWNMISQRESKKASENLYKNNQNVSGIRSQLIDSYAWDTTVNWLKKAGIVTEYDSSHHIDSKEYGNYYYSTFDFSNALYIAYSSYIAKSGGWFVLDYTNDSSKNYKYGSQNVRYETEIEPEKQNSYSQKFIKASLSLGATDNTKTKNIYDLAGNLAEWTTEEGKQKNETNPEGVTGTYAVMRGGAYSSNNNESIVQRHGSQLTGNASYSFGFRVVLYLE